MSDRSLDWMEQALRDVQHARHSRDVGDFEWACFAAQQGAEKAVKSLALHLGGDPWGHSVTALLEALPDECAPDAVVRDAAKALDKHYIPTRYPSGFDSGAPGKYYTGGEAATAIQHAEVIVAHCRNHLR